jgi:hypothetical protein
MPIIYDMQGYPHFVVDLAERRPDGARKTVQAAMLLVRSFFDEGEQRMTSIDDIDIGTPANGWTIRFTGVTGAQPPEAYIATYRNGEISYNEDPNRQAASMSERVWYAVDFAKGKGGSKGSGKTKNCTKGKLCGGSCIAKGRNCRIEANAAQKKAADALSKASADDAAKAKAAVKKEKTGEKAAKQKKASGVTAENATGSDFFAKELADFSAKAKLFDDQERALDDEIANIKEMLKQPLSRQKSNSLYDKKYKLEQKKYSLIKDRDNGARSTREILMLKAQQYVEAKRALASPDQIVSVKKHGMSSPEVMTPIEFDGLTIYGSPEKQSESIVELMMSREWNTPNVRYLNSTTKAIYLTDQRSYTDAYWKERNHEPGFKSAASGGGGDIVVYNGKALSSSLYYHEAAHNLATKLYGTSTPPSGSDFGSITTQSPTKYGNTSRAEDFADSVMLYFTGRASLLDAERKYVLDRIFADPNYGG